MERRFTNVGIQLRETDKAKTIAGYGARYYDGSPGTEYVWWDNRYERVVERIVAGAFDRAAREDDVRGMYNHRQILGRTKAGTMRLAVDSQGLRYEIDIPDTTVGRDVAEVIRRGDVTGSSFAFSVPNEGERWTSSTDASGKRHYLRELLKLDLFDTGPVDYPAYEATSTGLRSSRRELDDLRSSLERFKAESEGGVRACIDQANANARRLEIGG